VYLVREAHQTLHAIGAGFTTLTKAVSWARRQLPSRNSGQSRTLYVCDQDGNILKVVSREGRETS